MRTRMLILLAVLLAACSKPADEGSAAAKPATDQSVATKGDYDGCALLSPAEIAAVIGGDVAPGVREPLGSLCRFKLSGETKFGHTSPTSEVEVNRFGIFQDRTSPSAKGIPMVDVPELGPDAYLQGIGTLWSKAPDGSTILITVSLDAFASSTKTTLAAKDAFVQLGKAAASHAHL